VSYSISSDSEDDKDDSPFGLEAFFEKLLCRSEESNKLYDVRINFVGDHKNAPSLSYRLSLFPKPIRLHPDDH
jgi:hypothetical protein